MKINLKKSVGMLLFLLLIINLYLYTKTMVLSDEMVQLESNMKKIRVENTELQKKLSSFNSLHNLSLVAENLGFTQKTTPTYFENLQYAKASFHE